MSNIYIQEPPTDGKVLLVTSVGDIDVELWSKETQKACRNFVQLCLEGYYDGTLFHRVVPSFIAQGGDPTGTGEGGESIYGATFKDELHSRLRFNRRGLLGMANAGKNDNASQFFFTLGEAGELNNKHTLFGKVTGDTIYNMIKLGECETEPGTDRPLFPHKIIKTKVLHNPFDDMVPRKVLKDSDKAIKKVKTKGKKDFKLLSFGEEAEEDEEQTTAVLETMKTKGKGKSSHDLLDDEKLSTIPAVDQTFDPPKKSKKKRKKSNEDGSSSSEEESIKTMVRKKLRKEDSTSMNFRVDDDSDGEIPREKSAKIVELKKEAKRLKKEIMSTTKEEEKAKSKDHDDEDEANEDDNDLVKEFKAEKRKYKEEKKKLKKTSARETDTLAMLASFQTKLSSAAMMAGLGGEDDEDEQDEKKQEEEEEEDDYDPSDMSWMTHKLTFEGHNKKVIDANTADLDRYEMFDPRNPLNIRKREASEKAMKSSGKKS